MSTQRVVRARTLKGQSYEVDQASAWTVGDLKSALAAQHSLSNIELFYKVWSLFACHTCEHSRTAVGLIAPVPAM